MRTGDVVTGLDGHYWWEFGTYPTQARAYDGKPHTFDLDRNGTALTVQLGEPFTS